MTDETTAFGRGALATTTDVHAHPVSHELLGDVAARQLARGIPADLPFLLVDVTDDGLRVTTVDPRLDASVAALMAEAIRPSSLDQLLAAHLIRTGRVEQPTTEEWSAELVDLASRARSRLASTDGTFIVGREYVQYFRVWQRDLDEATAGPADGVARLCEEAAVDAPGRITSVVLAGGHEAWPGLAPMLGRRAPVPVIALMPAGTPEVERSEPRHDDGVPLGAAPPTPDLIVPETVPSAPPVAPRTGDFPAPMAGGSSERPRASPPDARRPAPETRGWEAGAGKLRPATRAMVWRQRLSGRRALIGIAALCAIVVIGAATAVAVSGGSDSDGSSASAEDATTATSGDDSAYADPADLTAARVPAATYVPPPPPPPPEPTSDNSSSGETATGRQRTGEPTRQPPPRRPRQNAPPPAPAPLPAPPPLPRQRVIPNPIPGLPPIVLPG
ncbi:hypothetical protein GTV32_18565 [Gordonia sp. SID5947]|uniref:hypothetical protein n=1 Tax=Gordonia sp. SID5947 TaxID=2690315 RepID=UPI00136A99F1|nr:hypothetical protein [Gordonia sp. SID5947]MYR08177.1 hypothetical protein [Gordonia sp. SID5947]